MHEERTISTVSGWLMLPLVIVLHAVSSSEASAAAMRSA